MGVPTAAGRQRRGSGNGSLAAEGLARGAMFAGELFEAGLGVAADRLVAAEQQLAETERDLADLDVADAEATWILGALRDLANVWCLMTTEKRGCLLRALVATARVKEETGVVEVVNFRPTPARRRPPHDQPRLADAAGPPHPHWPAVPPPLLAHAPH
ncbi:hypothetical protein [Sorangium sp. So ce426]|uniref:hypothetical protein n=1 Tax=Sorangium sp. So ce426 TaxID=3133312 RepID=UPI003F5C5E9A